MHVLAHTLAFFFECQLSLLIIVLVLSTTSIFASLSKSCQQLGLMAAWRESCTFPLFLGIATVEDVAQVQKRMVRSMERKTQSATGW